MTERSNTSIGEGDMDSRFFTQQCENKLYAYWEGENRHWFYDMCWETVKLRNPGAIILSKNNVVDIIGAIPKEIEDAYITHRCDWIRKEVIHALGGVWVDMVYICWSDLSFLKVQSQIFDYVGYIEWNGGWMDNFFAARKGSPILRAAADSSREVIAMKGSKIEWLDASTGSIEPTIGKFKWSLINRLPTHVVTPVSSTDPNFFLGEREEEAVRGYRSLGCMASYHTLRKHLNGSSARFHSRDDVLQSSTGLGACLRRALGQVNSVTARRRSAPSLPHLSPEEAKIEEIVTFDWSIVVPTHIPVACRSENLGDDIQAEAARRLWGVDSFVDRDNPRSWPSNAVVPLVGWWGGRGAFPTKAMVKVVGFHLANEGISNFKMNRSWLARVVAEQGFPAMCRDLRTRDLLRSWGIDAEFSGCVSLTLNRDDRERSDRKLAVDYYRLAAPGYERLTNTDDSLRSAPPRLRLQKASERLEDLASALKVKTSRLHIWLPCLALGTDVEFSQYAVGSRERLPGYNVAAQRIDDLFRVNRPPSRFRNISGWMDYGDIYRDIAVRLPDGGTFVELGVYQGRSLCYMAEYLRYIGKSALLFGYDIFDSSRYSLGSDRLPSGISPNDWANTVEREIREFWGSSVSVVSSRSDKAARFHENASVDAIFIDASHQEDAVYQDITEWLPKLKLNGVMAGHDFTSNFPGVGKAIKRVGIAVEKCSVQCWKHDRR